MTLVVISPEHDDPRERAVLGGLFAAGLDRYHLRKPHTSLARLADWIGGVPAEYRSRLVLHQHHELAGEFALGGCHWKDTPDAPTKPCPHVGLMSRSCHSLRDLRQSFGVYDSVFFGPIFASISKPGYGPRDSQVGEALGAILHTRSAVDRQTAVIALGGITVATIPMALMLGFDGVAVLGAVWQSRDPVAAFREIASAYQAARERQSARRRAILGAPSSVPLS